MKLNEALKKAGFNYKSINHPRYKVHDPSPEVLILDPDYYKNEKAPWA